MGVNKVWKLSDDIIWFPVRKSVYSDVSLHARATHNSKGSYVTAGCMTSVNSGDVYFIIMQF